MDDWNLNGKIRVVDSSVENPYTGKASDSEYWQCEEVYHKDVIDVLRLKLIEDLQDYYNRYLVYQIDEEPCKLCFGFDIKKIINKRFGVE